MPPFSARVIGRSVFARSVRQGVPGTLPPCIEKIDCGAFWEAGLFVTRFRNANFNSRSGTYAFGVGVVLEHVANRAKISGVEYEMQPMMNDLLVVTGLCSWDRPLEVVP